MPAVYPKVIHDTIRVVAHGTTVVLDRLLPTAGESIHGPFPWEKLLTLIGLIVIPLVAALIGAKEGGRQARKAASEEFRRQTEEADAREKARVKRRVIHDVETVNHVEQAMVAMGPLRPSPAVIQQLILPWQDYRGWRDSTSLLRDPEFESRLTVWYDAIPLCAGMLEQASIAVLGQVEETGAVDAEWTAKSAVALDKLKALAGMGRGLLKDLARQ